MTDHVDDLVVAALADLFLVESELGQQLGPILRISFGRNYRQNLICFQAKLIA
jgi:hypothetical protein